MVGSNLTKRGCFSSVCVFVLYSEVTRIVLSTEQPTWPAYNVKKHLTLYFNIVMMNSF